MNFYASLGNASNERERFWVEDELRAARAAGEKVYARKCGRLLHVYSILLGIGILWSCRSVCCQLYHSWQHLFEDMRCDRGLFDKYLKANSTCILELHTRAIRSF